MSKRDAITFEEVWAAAEEQKAVRAALMPTEQDAINRMQECYLRLKELGWNDAIYCPKDGSEFDVVESGSTGVFKCVYDGEWPDGGWWVIDAGDMWPSRPILYRPTEAEKTRWELLKKGFGTRCKLCGTAAPESFVNECNRPECPHRDSDRNPEGDKPEEALSS